MLFHYTYSLRNMLFDKVLFKENKIFSYKSSIIMSLIKHFIKIMR